MLWSCTRCCINPFWWKSRFHRLAYIKDRGEHKLNFLIDGTTMSLAFVAIASTGGMIGLWWGMLEIDFIVSVRRIHVLRNATESTPSPSILTFWKITDVRPWYVCRESICFICSYLRCQVCRGWAHTECVKDFCWGCANPDCDGERLKDAFLCFASWIKKAVWSLVAKKERDWDLYLKRHEW